MGFTTQLLEYTGATFVAELGNVLVAIFAVVEVLMILYAVYICYLFATATDESKRKNAKNRLIKVFSSCLIIFAFALALRAVDINFTTVKTDNDEGGKDINFSALFVYNDTPVINIGPNETTTIILSPAHLLMNAAPAQSGVVFKSFAFNDASVSSILLLNNSDSSSDGSLICNFKCVDYINGFVSNQISFLYKSEDDLNMYVTGVATLEFQGKEYSIAIWVKLGRCRNLMLFAPDNTQYWADENGNLTRWA